jgi:hypothetical protein
MARESGGGGGAFAWTLLGFLAGVAATLGVQMLMSSREAAPTQVATAPAPAHIVVQTSPPPAAPAPAKKPASVASAASAAPPAVRQAAEEVADDAAATGMTSRISRSAPTDSAGAASNN